MKRILLVLLSLTFAISLIGCSSVDASNKISIAKENTTSSDSSKEVDYKICNLGNDDYNLSVYTKEYKKGKIVSDNSAQTEMTVSDVSNISVSIAENDGNIEITTGDNFLSFPLSFYADNDSNMVLSVIDSSKDINLNKEYPIAVYSIAAKNNSTKSFNLEDDFQLGNNSHDLVVYLKLTK